MARLIRTEKEVEGRYTEQWIVVEEDVLEQWPEGPLQTVGRPATRVDGLARARCWPSTRGTPCPTTVRGPSGHCSSTSSSTTIHCSV